MTDLCRSLLMRCPGLLLLPRLCLLLLLILLPGAVPCAAVADEPAGPERWEPEIRRLEARMAEVGVLSGRPVFIGSSSVRLWKLERSFPGLDAVNQGFGGSNLSDAVHFFGRLVTPLKPSAIVVYAGDNDIARGRTAEQVAADFQQLVAGARQALSAETPILFLSIKPSLKRWALAEEMQRANGLIRDWSQRQPHVKFVDIWKPMLGADGQPRPGLFQADGLHLNEAGYQLWTEILRPELPQSAGR